MQVLFADACKMTVALYGESEMDKEVKGPILQVSETPAIAVDNGGIAPECIFGWDLGYKNWVLGDVP